MSERHAVQVFSVEAEPNGRSTGWVECPSCHRNQVVVLWSFAGSGKRCECGVVLTWKRG